mgnify:CR=1 FL=1
MQITITKGQAEDRIAIVLANGRQLDSTFPKKGFIPHDAVHLFVERELGLKNAFWGMVASGSHPEEIAGIAKAAGHASASRNTVPDGSIVELLQAERLVEWDGASHDDGTASAIPLASPGPRPTTVSTTTGTYGRDIWFARNAVPKMRKIPRTAGSCTRT